VDANSPTVDPDAAADVVAGGAAVIGGPGTGNTIKTMIY